VSILGQILSNSPTLWAVAMAATATSSRLDADLVKRLSGQYELSSVSRLDLRNMDLSDISVLRACTGLVALDLRGNAVSRKLQRPDQQANDRLTRGVMQ
jgi:Leucine-rich repeat (LRR) protein